MPSMHPRLRVVEHVEVSELELLPACCLLATLIVAVGTLECLLHTDSILPLLVLPN